MEMIAQGIVYDSARQPPQRRVTCFPALCRTRSGRWLAAFQVGSAKHAIDSTIEVCQSEDEGKTWQQLSPPFANRVDGIAGSFAAAEMIETQPGRLLMVATWFDRRDPARPLFDPQTEGILHSKQLRATSDDSGEHWSAWEEVPTSGLTGCSLTGPFLEWPDGVIALPFESQQTFDSPNRVPHSAWLMVSRDRGETFDDPHLVATHPEGTTCYWDQRLCPTDQLGEYIAAFWTHDRRAQRDLPIHLRRGRLNEPSFDVCSVKGTDLQGQIAAPLWLGEQQILLFAVDRGRPGTLRLYKIRDSNGKWSVEDQLTVYRHEERAAITQGATGIDYAAYWEDMGKWTFGHPVIQRIDSSQVLLSYYAGTPASLGIHWVRICI